MDTAKLFERSLSSFWSEIYPPSSGKQTWSWSKSRFAQDGLGYSFSLKVKWGYISVQKLESERSKSFAVSISRKTKTIRGYLRVLGTGKYPKSCVKSSWTWSNSRCAWGGLGYTISVWKWSGILFRPRSSKVRVQKNLLCPFHCKTRPSAPSLASKGLENIPQVPEYPPEVCQNHDARKAVSATFTVLK